MVQVGRINRKGLAFGITLYGAALVVMAIVVYPVWFIVVASFSDPTAVSTGKVWFLPVGFTLDGYRALLANGTIWIGYRNTILYAIAGTFIALAVNVPAAYALSRTDLAFRWPITIYFLITMFFSGGLIPTFLVVQDFGLYDTFWVMVLPFSVSIYNIIVARTFFQGNIPSELREAAEMEGCGNIRFFFTMVLPLSKAIISVLALWSLVGHWNSYFTALVYLRDAALYPLQLILRNILVSNQMMSAMGTGEAAQIALRTASLIRYAAIIVATLPVMLMYPFVQKHFNQGVMIGAVKG